MARAFLSPDAPTHRPERRRRDQFGGRNVCAESRETANQLILLATVACFEVGVTQRGIIALQRGAVLSVVARADQ